MSRDRDRARAPFVTAVLTNHDYGEFVAEAIESALAQDYAGAVEVVVVDDGSTDRSLEVLDGFGDRIRVIRQPNQGQLVALRVGLEAAAGEVVCLLDADDAWSQDKARRVVEELERSGAEWVAHGLDVGDERLRPTGGRMEPQGRWGAVPGDPLLFLERRAGAPTSGLAFTAGLAGRLVEALRVVEEEHAAALRYDADRVLLALAGSLGAPGWQIPDALGVYRRHGRQQFGGDRSDAAMLERQVEVDLVVADVLATALGGYRLPTAVSKHRLVARALRGEGGRWRELIRGLRSAARLAPGAPALAVRQTLALLAAAAAPRRWMARVAERQGSSGAAARQRPVRA